MLFLVKCGCTVKFLREELKNNMYHLRSEHFRYKDGVNSKNFQNFEVYFQNGIFFNPT
jgi:hypothetical protein